MMTSSPTPWDGSIRDKLLVQIGTSGSISEAHVTTFIRQSVALDSKWVHEPSLPEIRISQASRAIVKVLHIPCYVSVVPFKMWKPGNNVKIKAVAIYGRVLEASNYQDHFKRDDLIPIDLIYGNVESRLRVVNYTFDLGIRNWKQSDKALGSTLRRYMRLFDPNIASATSLDYVADRDRLNQIAKLSWTTKMDALKTKIRSTYR